MSEARFAQPPAEPIAWLQEWIQEGRSCGMREPTAMNLATVDAAGRPSNRVVLFKGMQGEDLCFYTNFGSRKAEQLAANPHAALCFWWDPMMRQLRLEGRTERLSEEASAGYFAGRPRGSQIGAWASRQSQPIADRAALEANFRRAEERFAASDEVPRPAFWGGYRLVIERIEFWQGQDNRFHDRIEYHRQAEGWTQRRLQP